MKVIFVIQCVRVVRTVASAAPSTRRVISEPRTPSMTDSSNHLVSPPNIPAGAVQVRACVRSVFPCKGFLSLFGIFGPI